MPENEQGLHLYTGGTPNGAQGQCCRAALRCCAGQEPRGKLTRASVQCVAPCSGHKPLIALEELGLPYTLHKVRLALARLVARIQGGYAGVGGNRR